MDGDGERHEKLYRILAIDGGGIRGLIAARILVSLEAKLQARTGNPNVKLADYFDLIAGTSTGGILTCVYLYPEGDTGRPRYSAVEAQELYVQHGADIFSIPVLHGIGSMGGLNYEKYPCEGLVNVLNSYFQDTLLSQLLKPCLITAYDIRRRKTMFFTQHDARESDGCNFYLRDVCRATTAAPTYFEPPLVKSLSGVSYPLIDGGVFANNPSLCAYAEGRTLFGAKASQMAILSIGTGEVRRPYPYEEAREYGAISWVKPLIDIMMSAMAETADYEIRLAFDAVGTPDQYLRVNVDMDRLPPETTSDLDNASPPNINGLLELGAEAAERNDDELDRFVELLVQEEAARV
jgi:patatin-like phospholipase/acyl hydrolase